MQRIQGIAWAVLVIVIIVFTVGAALFITSRDSPRRAVEDYVTALAEGNAARARARLAVQPADGRLLADAVLRRLHDGSRGVTRVVSVDDRGAEVEIARQRVRLDLAPEVRDARWYVHGVVTVAPTVTPAVAVRVEGVAVPAGSWALFPGSYQVTAGNPLLALSAPELRAAAVAPATYTATASLVPEAQAQLREKVAAVVGGCAGHKELAPEGCPWALDHPRNARVDPATLTVKASVANLSGAQFTLGDDGAARADLDIDLAVSATADLTSRAGKAPFNQDHRVATTAVVDLAGPDASVSWAAR